MTKSNQELELELENITLYLYLVTAFVAGIWAVLLGWWVLSSNFITRGCQDEDRNEKAAKEADEQWQADQEWEASKNRIEERLQKDRKEKKAKRDKAAKVAKCAKIREEFRAIRKAQRQADMMSVAAQARVESRARYSGEAGGARRTHSPPVSIPFLPRSKRPPLKLLAAIGTS